MHFNPLIPEFQGGLSHMCTYFHKLTLMLLVANFVQNKMMQKNWKMTETLVQWVLIGEYSASTQECYPMNTNMTGFR